MTDTRDSDAVSQVEQLRAANKLLHRRAQSAETGLTKALDEKYKKGEHTFGRALANSAATMYREEAAALRQRAEDLELMLLFCAKQMSCTEPLRLNLPEPIVFTLKDNPLLTDQARAALRDALNTKGTE